MERGNPMEELIGAKGTAKLTGLSLLDLDSMTVRELRRHGLTAVPRPGGSRRHSSWAGNCSKLKPTCTETLRRSAVPKRLTGTCGRGT